MTDEGATCAHLVLPEGDDQVLDQQREQRVAPGGDSGGAVGVGEVHVLGGRVASEPAPRTFPDPAQHPDLPGAAPVLCSPVETPPPTFAGGWMLQHTRWRRLVPALVLTAVC